MSRTGVAIAALLCWGMSPAFAVSPSVAVVTPAGGKLGTDIEITLSGVRLDDAKELLIYDPGIKVITLQPNKDGKQVKSLLRIAADCPLGEHQLRLRTLTGLSELRTFFVGALSVNKEVEPNNEMSKAQIVPANTTVTGVITTEDADYFKVEAKKGERFSVEVEAIRLGRTLFDAYLAVLDDDGKTIAECDDSVLFLQDPVISFISKKSGFYYVMLRDTSWGGGNDSYYRLHVGGFPRPTAVFPPGGQAGSDVKVMFLGDPEGPIETVVHLPKTATGDFPLVAESKGLKAPSANRFRVSSFPNILESSDNHDLMHATASLREGPVAFNGIIGAAGEADWFSFRAVKKQPLEISVYARRLRSPLDPVLQLIDIKGKVIDTNDDAAGVDSVIKFTPDEAGVYYLKIFDQLRSGGSDFVYRIEVRSPASSATLSIPEVARNDSQSRQFVNVARGNRMATLMNVKRANFNGDLTFSVPGLPTGVSLHAEMMPAGVDTMPFVFVATAEAELSASLVEPTARPRTADKSIDSSYRHKIELVRAGNDQVYYATHSDRLPVTVIQEVPFELTLEAPSVPLVRAGSMKLRMKVERRSGFDEAINVKMLWNPPGVSSETEVIIPKGKSSADYAINAKGDAGLATWKIVAVASAAYKGGTAFASSDLTPIRVTEPFIVGKISPVTTEAGKTIQIKCALDQKEPFEGKAVARLIGLPDKVVAPDKEITKDDKEVSFDIVLDPKIAPGSHKNLSCQVQIKKGSDTIVQAVGSGGILRIVPPKKAGAEPKKVASLETKASGK